MHELPVAESILEIAIRHGRQNDAVKITHLHLVIGQLSSVIDDSIRFYWDMIAEGTIAEGASLSFRRIAVEMQCQGCSAVYSPTPKVLACPQCGSSRVKVLKGNEFYLDSIDIERSTDSSEQVGKR